MTFAKVNSGGLRTPWKWSVAFVGGGVGGLGVRRRRLHGCRIHATSLSVSLVVVVVVVCWRRCR